jgi:hypothetical protein
MGIGLATGHSLPASLKVAGFTASGGLLEATRPSGDGCAFTAGFAVERRGLAAFEAKCPVPETGWLGLVARGAVTAVWSMGATLEFTARLVSASALVELD